MTLKSMISGFSCTIIAGDENREINHLIYDSREPVTEGDVFVCLSGVRFDGHDYIENVAKAGAAAVVVEKEPEGLRGIAEKYGITVVLADDTREALSYMSAAYFGYPAKELTLVGITGTKGKTTVSYMIYEALNLSGIGTGLIGTVETVIGNEHIPSENTTPQSFIVQKYFRQMADAGLRACVMEVSSQGIMQHRVAGITYDIGVFTNLSPDHIGAGEHSSFEEYAACKRRLFANCKKGLFNADDEHFEYMIKDCGCDIITFGTSGETMYRADNVELRNIPGKIGISFDVNTDTGRGRFAVPSEQRRTGSFNAVLNIPGAFNVSNALTAVAVCSELGVKPEIICEAIKDIKVKGRVEPVNISTRFSLMIDYAHNAVSLKSVLETLREYHPKRLVCLFGCGGNRSKDRRFEMGEISSNLADFTIATSDNPRFEKPEDILADIVVGIERGKGKYIAICDRKEAIRYAIEKSEEGDLIILAGKGHEDYQEICGVKHHMDERDLIREVVEEMSDEERNRLCLTLQ